MMVSEVLIAELQASYDRCFDAYQSVLKERDGALGERDRLRLIITEFIAACRQEGLMETDYRECTGKWHWSSFDGVFYPEGARTTDDAATPEMMADIANDLEARLEALLAPSPEA